MASPEFENLRKYLKPGLADANDPPMLVREKMIAVHPTTWSDDAQIEELELGGVSAAWVRTPESKGEDRYVLFSHGGAFVSTELIHYKLYAEHVSRATRAQVLIYAYSLAPEARFPVALDESLAVYHAARATGMDPERTAFMGDSCGGGIALATMLSLRDSKDALPACYGGLTPWFDAQQDGDAALKPRAVDPYVNRDWIRARFRDYAGPDGDLSNPLISPLLGDFRGLPPMFLGVGQIDTTSDDSTRLAARAARDGVAVTLESNPEMIHGFHGLCGAFPEATDAMARIGEFVRRHIP